MKQKPLHIPQSKKLRCLTIYCRKCKTNVSEVCKETGKPLKSCQFGEKHNFKIYAWVPGSKNERKTKSLQTRNINEAIKETIQFTDKVKNEARNLTNEGSMEKTFLLNDCVKRYLSWLRGDNVPAHERRERSPEYVAEVERALHCLKDSIGNIWMEELNNEAVGKVYAYLLEEKQFANATFNKYVTMYVSFVGWAKEELGINVRNWFERIKRKETHYNPETIAKEEFEKLLQIINEKNGVKEYMEGKKRIRNYYRDWLPSAFSLALHTGFRREELINLRFKNIEEKYIKVENYKVNNIQNRSDDGKKWKYAPMTKELKELLITLGYEKHKDTERFLLANDIQAKRKRAMSDILSRGFSHFYSQLKTGKELHFGCLRKTHLSRLSAHLGNNAKVLSGHTNDETLHTHYVDPKVIAEAAKNFEIFPEQLEREKELNGIRKKQEQEKEIDLGR